MTLLRYFLREYMKYVAGIVVLCAFLFVLFDVIHRSAKYFPRYNPSTRLIIEMYLCQLPASIVQSLPIAGLLASMVTMSLFNRSNEITAMRAAGMGPVAVSIPLVVGGAILSLVGFLLAEFVAPNWSKRAIVIQRVEIEGESDSVLGDGVRWVRSGDGFVHFKGYNPVTRTIEGLEIISLTEDFKFRNQINAGRATYDSDTRAWTIFQPNRRTFTEDSLALTLNGSNRVLELPFRPEKLQREWRLPNDMGLRELSELIESGERVGADTLPYRVDFHFRIAFSFAALIVSLVGLRFAYRSERTAETVRSLLAAFATGVAYFILINMGLALAKSGQFHPAIGGWLANALSLGIILLQIQGARRPA